MADERRRWVELRRLRDPVEAKIVVDFLTDHGITVQELGGATQALPALGLNDFRIEVPLDQLEQATEVLAALREGTVGEHPFRGGTGERPPESYQAPVDVRRWPFAAGLAVLVPIGAGHFYARHGAAASILAAGMVGSLIGVFAGMPALAHAWWILVAVDALFSPLAVRRYNAGAVTAEGTQRMWALGAVVLALAAAVLSG